MNKTKKKVNSKTRKYKHHIFKRKTRNNVKRRLKRKNRTIKGGTNMKEVILGQLKAIRFDKYNNNAIQLYDDDFWSGQLNPTIDTLIIPAITKLHTLETKYKQNKTSIEDMLIIGKQILIYKQASHCRREGEREANKGRQTKKICKDINIYFLICLLFGHLLNVNYLNSNGKMKILMNRDFKIQFMKIL